MKKSLLVLGLAVAAFTSCSNDEVLDINKNTNIGFDAFVNKGTRNVAETTTLSKFFVYGYYGTTNVFNGTEVTKDGLIWKYNGGNHTEWTSGNYYFGAYANGAAADALSNVSFASGKLTIEGYTVNNANDLVAAVKNVNNSGFTNPTVDLTFQHMLSKVCFELTNASSEALTMKVTDITFDVNTVGTCEYDGTDVSWKEFASPTALTYPGTTANIAQGGVHATKENLVIPGQTIPTVDITVTFYNSSDTEIDTKTFNDVSLAVAGDVWKAGYAYKYTAEIKPTMPTIEFNASIEDWKPGTEVLD